MQSRSVQSRIRSRQNSVACRSRLRIPCMQISSARICSWKLLLLADALSCCFLLPLARVDLAHDVQVRLLSLSLSLSLSRLSLPLALLCGLICGRCTCLRLFPELEYLRRFAVVLSHLFLCDGDSLRFIPKRKRSRFLFLSFKNWLVKLRADFGLSVAGSIFFVKSVVTGAKTVTNVV